MVLLNIWICIVAADCVSMFGSVRERCGENWPLYVVERLMQAGGLREPILDFSFFFELAATT